jgi:hypothetical protein
MYIKDIIQSTLDLENYDFYLPEEDFLLADLTFKDVYEVDQLDYECTEEPEPEEIAYEEELSLDDFID